MLNFTPPLLGRTSLFTAIFIATALTFFSPCDAAGGGKSAITDSRDSKVYKTVKMPDGKVWFAENLNYAAEGSKCYENKEENCQKYGRLYNWATAMKACPKGWHLPNEEEWKSLNFGNSETAGKKLKAASGWNEGGNGKDIYGFAALPGGFGYSDGSFGSAGDIGFWWSATEDHSGSAYSMIMYYDNEYARWYYFGKTNLYSVRCSQD